MKNLVNSISYTFLRNGRVHQHNTDEFPPPEPFVISSINTVPPVRQESFLRQKYEVEELSIRQIAAITFSARSVVSRYMKEFGIPLRDRDTALRLNKGQLALGERLTRQGVVCHRGESETIALIVKLRSKDYSYRQIAAELTRRKIPTKNGRQEWAAATVMKIGRRAAKSI